MFLAECPAFGAHRRATFAILLAHSPTPARFLARLPRTRFPIPGKRGYGRTRHAPAATVVLQLWWAHGNIAVAVARVDAAAVADELFGQYWLRRGHVIVEGKRVPRIARGAIVAMSAVAQRGVRGFWGDRVAGRRDQCLPHHSRLPAHFLPLIPLGTCHSSAP